jgi:nicotinamidase-related amidase
VRGGNIRQVDLPCRADAEFLRPGPGGGEIVDLDDQHVAALTAAIEVAARGGVGLDRSDDLQEIGADAHDRVFETEDPDTGVGEWLAEAEPLAQASGGRLQLRSHEHGLAKTCHVTYQYQSVGYVSVVMANYVSPEFESAALVSIDVQRDVLDGQPFEVAGTSAAAAAIALLAAAFRDAGRPVVHIVRLYREDGSNVDPCRRGAVEDGLMVLVPESPGAEIAEGLVPDGSALDAELLLSGGVQQLGPNEVAIYKPRWGAFYETPLQDHLRALGVSTLVFCGCNFPNCPRTSIYEASERDFRVVLAEDAVSGLYDRGRDELLNIGVVLMSTEEITASLQPAPALPRHPSA